MTSVMALTTVSVIMTVMVLSFFYRGPYLRPVPDWAKRFVSRWPLKVTEEQSFKVFEYKIINWVLKHVKVRILLLSKAR